MEGAGRGTGGRVARRGQVGRHGCGCQRARSRGRRLGLSFSRPGLRCTLSQKCSQSARSLGDLGAMTSLIPSPADPMLRWLGTPDHTERVPFHRVLHIRVPFQSGRFLGDRFGKGTPSSFIATRTCRAPDAFLQWECPPCRNGKRSGRRLNAWAMRPSHRALECTLSWRDPGAKKMHYRRAGGAVWDLVPRSSRTAMNCNRQDLFPCAGPRRNPADIGKRSAKYIREQAEAATVRLSSARGCDYDMSQEASTSESAMACAPGRERFRQKDCSANGSAENGRRSTSGLM